MTRKLATIVTSFCMLLGHPGLAQQLVYDSAMGLNPFTSTVGFENNPIGVSLGAIVADKISLGGSDRQLASIDVTMLIAPGDSAEVHINLYRDDHPSGSGPGSFITSSVSKSYDFFGQFTTTPIISFADTDFLDMPVNLGDDFYVGVQLDSFTAPPTSFTGVGLVPHGVYAAGMNDPTEGYFLAAPGPSTNFVEIGVAPGAEAFALTVIAQVPEPAAFGLIGLGLIAIVGARRLRR